MKDNLRLIPAATVCRCAGCEGLAARYGSDPDLLAFLRKNLLKRGWAGSTDEVEQGYMLAHAPWYKAAVERGRETATRTGQFKRVPLIGAASGAKDEELGGQRHGAHPPQGQLALPMAVV